MIHPTTLFLDDDLADQTFIYFEFFIGVLLYLSSQFISPNLFFMTSLDTDQPHIAHELFDLAERAGVMLRPDFEERFGSIM